MTKSKNPRTFGERLLEAVQEAGGPKEQEPLSKWFKENHQITISGAMINKYKRLDKLPRMEQCREFSIALGVCVEWLLTGRGAKFPSEGLQSVTEGRLLAMWRTWNPNIKWIAFEKFESIKKTQDILTKLTKLEAPITEEQLDAHAIDTISETGEFRKLSGNQ